jgi:DNA-binding GntR family transcriptional regulator
MFRPPTGHVSPHTLRDTAAQRLRDDIVTGALRPNEILKDVDLALRLDISTTPVREALSQLALERLIIMPANRPKRVAPLSKRYALEMYAVFRLLAADAYRRGSPELGPEAVAAMRRAHEALRAAIATGDRRAAVAASRSFHDRVIKAAGNGALRRTCARSFVWLERAFYCADDVSGANAAVDLQAQALAAIERGDHPAGAEALLAALDRFATVIEALPDDAAATREPLRAPSR